MNRMQLPGIPVMPNESASSLLTNPQTTAMQQQPQTSTNQVSEVPASNPSVIDLAPAIRCQASG